MAGLIQSKAGGAAITPQSIMAQLHLTPPQAQQIQRIVVAGMKVMFSPQSHNLMTQQLQGPAPMPQKLGQGVAGLMGLLAKESNNTLPPKLMVPAGMVLVAHAADFLRKAGQQVSDVDVGNAIQILIQTLLKSAKLDPNLSAATAAQPPQGA
jgi:hypothetical protein